MNINALVVAGAIALGAGCGGTTKSVGTESGTACASQRDACRVDLDKANKRMGELQAQLDKEKGALDLAKRRLNAYREIAEKFRKAFDAANLQIVIRNGRLVVQLPNQILYASGKAELTPEGIELVATLAEVLKTIPDRSFIIAGHTDNMPVHKRNTTFKSNWELSTQRALAVVLLLEKDGVSGTQLAAAGYGEFLPDAPNDTDEGRAENRRTEIIIMPTLDEIPALPKNL